MTNLDDLVDAMAAPPDFAPRPIDLASVMAAGGRVRRRRRLVAGAASGLAVAALLVGGAQFAASQAAPDRSGPAPAAEQRADNGVLGEAIATGRGEWLLFATPIDRADLPDTHFGLNLGLPGPNGRPVSVVTTNENKGSDRTPGFHAIEGAMEVNGSKTPTFGYYVGPATKITATAKDTTVTARQAAWSEDPSVVVFWFDPDARSLDHLRAYDSDGRALPAGDNKVTVG